MLIFTSITDPRLARLPPTARTVVLHQLHTLRSLGHSESDLVIDGFVGYVEPQETPESVEMAIGRTLSQIEAAFMEGDCLIGVVLWGNAGAGITFVCPQSATHAPQVAQQLRHHLPTKER